MRPLFLHLPSQPPSPPLTSDRQIALYLKQYLNQHLKIECPTTGKTFQPKISWLKFDDLYHDAYDCQSIKAWEPRPFAGAYNNLLNIHLMETGQLVLGEFAEPDASYFHLFRLRKNGFLKSDHSFALTNKGVEYLDFCRTMPANKYAVPFSELISLIYAIFTKKPPCNAQEFGYHKLKKDFYFLINRFSFNGLIECQVSHHDEYTNVDCEFTERGLEVIRKYLKKCLDRVLSDTLMAPKETVFKLHKFMFGLLPKKRRAIYLVNMVPTKAGYIKHLFQVIDAETQYVPQ